MPDLPSWLMLGISTLAFLGGVYTFVRGSGKHDEAVGNRITNLESFIKLKFDHITEFAADVKKIIGNGTPGMRNEIDELQRHCAAEQARVEGIVLSLDRLRVKVELIENHLHKLD